MAAHDAAAQGFIVPFIGTTLTSPGPNGDSTKPGYGVAFGGMGKIVGAETEIAYYPEVIDTAPNAIAKSRVISFSGGMLIGPRLGPVTAVLRHRRGQSESQRDGRGECARAES